MKKCSSCKEYKNIEKFGNNASKPDGLSDWCKPCKEEYDKEYYRKNSEKVRLRRRKYYYKNQEKALKYNSTYSAENKDLLCKKRKEYYKNNKESIVKKKAMCREETRKKGVYKITHIPTKKIYFGSSSHLIERLRNHKCQLKAGKHKNPNLQRLFNATPDFDKYFKFDIIIYEENVGRRIGCEIDLINNFACLNITNKY